VRERPADHAVPVLASPAILEDYYRRYSLHYADCRQHLDRDDRSIAGCLGSAWLGSPHWGASRRPASTAPGSAGGSRPTAVQPW
jgi:hypothetical protein